MGTEGNKTDDSVPSLTDHKLPEVNTDTATDTSTTTTTDASPKTSNPDFPRNGSRVSFSENNDHYVFDSKLPSKYGSSVSFSVNGRQSTAYLLNSDDILRETLVQKYTSCRWMTTYMCFGAIMLSVMLRQCMSMAIVCMENNSAKIGNQSWTGNDSNIYHEENPWNIRWDSEVQGLVLSSYFYGFPATPLLGGYLSGRFSGKKVVASMTTVLIVTSAVIPISATISPYIVIVLRVIVGLSSGGLNPSIAAILSKWAPLAERSQITAVANAGLMVGTIFTFALSGIICELPVQNGWPFIFYIFGICNVFGLIMWLVCVYDYPDEHPRVTWKERVLISRNRRDSTVEKMPSPPWLKILTSGPFYGLLFAHVSHGFLFTTIGTFLPIYMNDVLRFDSTSNGLLSSLPFIGRFIGTVVSGYVADHMLAKQMMSVTVTRKLFHFLGMAISAPFLLALSFLDYRQRDIVVVLLVTYWTTQALNNSGFRVNHLDIAPRFAGVLNGMTTTCASLAALISPILTAELTKNGTREEWQVVFGICIAIGLGGAFAFVILGSAQEQEWAKDPNLNIDIEIEAERRASVISGLQVPDGNPGVGDEGKGDQIDKPTDKISDSEAKSHVNGGISTNGFTNRQGLRSESNYSIGDRGSDLSGRGGSQIDSNESNDVTSGAPAQYISAAPYIDESAHKEIKEDKIIDRVGIVNPIFEDEITPHFTKLQTLGAVDASAVLNEFSIDEKSTFMMRTRHSRENLRLVMPHVNESYFHDNDKERSNIDDSYIVVKL